MIVVRLEMWPKGDHARARSLGIATISNKGGTAESGDYECVLFKAPEYSRNAEKRPLHEMLNRPLAKEIWRRGVVDRFQRLRLGPWDLLFRALASAVQDRNPVAVEGEFLGGSLESLGQTHDEERGPPTAQLTMPTARALDEPTGKMHCGDPETCRKEPYSEDRCDCACDTRCGPWNEWKERTDDRA